MSFPPSINRNHDTLPLSFFRFLLQGPSCMHLRLLMAMSSSSSEAIMSFLLSLPSAAFSDLVRSLAADLRVRRRRLATLLLSPLHFSLTLSYLCSLSLPSKALLLARLLLSSLQKLLPSLAPPSPRPLLRLRDLDASLLLMAMCDSYVPPSPVGSWRAAVVDDFLATSLTPRGLGDTAWNAVVCHYVDAAVRCRRLLEVMSCGAGSRDEAASGGHGASPAAVVALPSVECKGDAEEEEEECAICKEEMERGRDVCEMPCRHRFHWGCALGWLAKRNTCPCCRHELPTDDVIGEMGRMWRAVCRGMGRAGAAQQP